MVCAHIRRPSVAVTAFIAALAAALAGGCGSGPTQAPAPDDQGRGAIHLPAGSPLRLADLQVAARGASPVAADGSFEFTTAGADPTLVVIGDHNNQPLLAGFVEPGQADSAVVDAQTTALVLLSVSAGACTYPTADQTHIRALLAADPAFAPFAATVAARLAASPLAIGDHDPALFAALQQTLEAMGAATMPAEAAPASLAPRPRPTARANQMVRAESGEVLLTSQLLAQPSATQSGLIVGSSDDLSGLQITNTRRRHLFMYVQQTGWQDASGVHNQLATPLADGTFTRDWVPSTNKLAGAIGSVTDVIVGHGAYQPYNTTPLPLPVLPQSATKAFYTVTVVGGGVDPGRAPKLGKEPYYTGANEMYGFGIFKDLFLPLMFAGLDRHLDLSHLEHAAELFKGFRGAVTIFGNGGHVVMGLSGGEPKEIVLSIFKTLADEPATRQLLIDNVLVPLVRKMAPELAADFGAEALQGFATKLNLWVALIDKALSLGDAAVAAHDMATSSWFEEWDVTAIPPVVHLKPGDATVLNLDILLLQVQTQVEGDFVYHWKTDGKYGHLIDTKGHSGLAFDSSEGMLTYAGDRTPPTGTTDTDSVTVTVYLIPKTGSTQARVKVNSASVALTRKAESQFGQATVNVTGAGMPSSWDGLIPMGQHTFTMQRATKAPSSLGTFVNAYFRNTGEYLSSFSWHGHVPQIAAGVTVPARPEGFAGSLDLSLRIVNNGVAFSALFSAYEGSINITNVVGNEVFFTATARLGRDPQDGYSHPPGSYGYIDVEVEGYTTLVDQ